MIIIILLYIVLLLSHQLHPLSISSSSWTMKNIQGRESENVRRKKEERQDKEREAWKYTDAVMILIHHLSSLPPSYNFLFLLLSQGRNQSLPVSLIKNWIRKGSTRYTWRWDNEFSARDERCFQHHHHPHDWAWGAHSFLVLFLLFLIILFGWFNSLCKKKGRVFMFITLESSSFSHSNLIIHFPEPTPTSSKIQRETQSTFIRHSLSPSSSTLV